MRALKRFIPGQRPAGGNTGQQDERAVAAATALRGWATVQSSGASGEQLGHAVRMLVAVPAGPERETLVKGELRKLLEPTLLPDCAAELLESVLELLCDAFDNRELANALSGALVALARDGRLEQHLTAIDTAEAASAAAGDKALADAERRCNALAAGTQKTSSMSAARQRCEALLHNRGQALEQAQVLLGTTARRVEQSAANAAEQRAKLQGELASAVASGEEAKSLSSLESEAKDFEDELLRLREHQQELRAELDRVSQDLEAGRAKQRTHMAQVDTWRVDRDGVKTATMKSKTDVEAELVTTESKRAACVEFKKALEAALTGLSDASSDAEAAGEALLEQADQCAGEASAALSAAASRQLSTAVERVRRAQAEDARARQTMELMEVCVTTAELPTRRPFMESVQALRRTWAELQQHRSALEAAQTQEVEALLGSVAWVDATESATTSQTQARAAPPSALRAAAAVGSDHPTATLEAAEAAPSAPLPSPEASDALVAPEAMSAQPAVEAPDL